MTKKTHIVSLKLAVKSNRAIMKALHGNTRSYKHLAKENCELLSYIRSL